MEKVGKNVIVISLNTVQKCIGATWNCWLNQTPKDFIVKGTADGDLPISIRIRDGNIRDTYHFDCGFADSVYRMPKGELDNLKAWCKINPGFKNGYFTYLGPDYARHPDSVNVSFRNGTYVMFNFHVNIN
eukprot:gene14105-15595_t